MNKQNCKIWGSHHSRIEHDSRRILRALMMGSVISKNKVVYPSFLTTAVLLETGTKTCYGIIYLPSFPVTLRIWLLTGRSSHALRCYSQTMFAAKPSKRMVGKGESISLVCSIDWPHTCKFVVSGLLKDYIFCRLHRNTFDLKKKIRRAVVSITVEPHQNVLQKYGNRLSIIRIRQFACHYEYLFDQ